MFVILKFLVFHIILTYLWSCLQFDLSSLKKENIDVRNIADVEVRNFFTGGFKLGRKTWELRSKKASFYEKKKKIVLEGVNFKFFNEKTRKQSTLIISDNGIYFKNNESIILSNNVTIINSNKTKLIGDYFLWDNQKELLSSHLHVKLIKSNGNILTGIGMTADKNLEKVVFEKNIEGTIEDINGDF